LNISSTGIEVERPALETLDQKIGLRQGLIMILSLGKLAGQSLPVFTGENRGRKVRAP
jgi:hypothetical protein